MGDDGSRAAILARLSAVIEERKGADPNSSYTAKLFDSGRAEIARKLGEEALETVIAALHQDNHALAAESADLIYHLLVLWADADLSPDEVWQELARREGTSGIDEKNTRSRN